MKYPPVELEGSDLAVYRELLELAGGEKAAWEAWERWKCLNDLYYLGGEVLGMGEARRGTKKIVDPTFHKWMAGVLQPKEDLLLLVPRWHLKTSWLKVSMIQELLRDPYSRQGLLSLTSGLSRMTLRSIMQMLCTKKLREIFPDRIPAPGKRYGNWQEANQDALTVYRPPRDGYMPQEPQISVYGIDSTMTGLHFDRWIGDDILDHTTVRSPAAMEKTEEWYQHARGKLDPDGYETYLGTHYHHQDLYSKMRKDGDIKRIFVRQAIENGKPIYRFFTHEILEKYRKRMGEYIYSCQMRNDPVPRADRLFPPPQPTYHELPEGVYRYYITVDPAATTKVYSDETAIVVAAVAENGMVYVLEAIHFKKSGDEIARILLDLNAKYKPQQIGIEFGLQEHLSIIIRMIREQYEKVQGQAIYLPITSVKIDPGRGKYDRFNLTLGSFIRSGKLKIKDSLFDLMEQMEFITANYRGKDDLVDALSMIFTIVKQFSYRTWAHPLGDVQKDWTTWEELFAKQDSRRGWDSRFAVS